MQLWLWKLNTLLTLRITVNTGVEITKFLPKKVTKEKYGREMKYTDDEKHWYQSYNYDTLRKILLR